MAFVKVCGIQTHDEASAALACGATALGVLTRCRTRPPSYPLR
jgi:phosphoribosylanthranilate isomerase